MTNRRLIIAAVVCAALALVGWGGTGHTFINTKAVLHLPHTMQTWIDEAPFFGAHASDADNRKGSDPTEGPKHYIDLELYPDYPDLSDNLDSLKTAVGESAVTSAGTLPWATRIAYDSLVAQLERNDWGKAKLTASDIGHYVGDGHQPLHNTDNYNGQLTGNNGIHSRYESTMINAHQAELVVVQEQVQYVDDVFAYCLAYSIQANAYVDSILQADDHAASVSGWSRSGSAPTAYYDALWERTRDLTILQMQRASVALASLWYSAALDAGTLTSADDDGGHGTGPKDFGLEPNFPNPFNPSTTIRFRSDEETRTLLTVHDLTGRNISTLVDGVLPAGTHQVTFDAASLAGGMYICMLDDGIHRDARKMLLLR